VDLAVAPGATAATIAVAAGATARGGRIPRRRRPRWRRGRGRGGGHGHGGGEWSRRAAGRVDLPAAAADHGFLFSFVFYF